MTAQIRFSQHKLQKAILLLASIVLALQVTVQVAEAGQGCPFDDGSCQEYCNQQGCNMGYCGHFAWIQCICRKCGDEWSWYDKVRYNPDKTVNQTELDSLKLNGTTTLILTSGQQQQQPTQQQQHQQVVAKANDSNSGNKPATAAAEVTTKQTATLTTLLIPDLSDTSGKLDLNDIPDENSDKFLDYLAKNHEKLVRATAASKLPADDLDTTEDDDETQIVEVQTSAGSTTTTSPQIDQDEPRDDETIEIQISTSNNNTSNEPITATSTTSSPPKTTTADQQQVLVSSTGSSAQPPVSGSTEPNEQQQQQRSPITRLLRMAVIERASDEID